MPMKNANSELTYRRSKGLAICHLGATADTPPLTAFSLSGCGDGTTTPLDDSEWEDLAAAASDTSAFSAPDDQQLTATYNGGVVHYDCRFARQQAFVTLEIRKL